MGPNLELGSTEVREGGQLWGRVVVQKGPTVVREGTTAGASPVPRGATSALSQSSWDRTFP